MYIVQGAILILEFLSVFNNGLPSKCLATKGIVPCDLLIRHDLIKSFSLPDLVKDFPDEKILNAKVTS